MAASQQDQALEKAYISIIPETTFLGHSEGDFSLVNRC